MYPCSPFLLFITLFILFPQTSDSQKDEYYRACAPKKFECGNFEDDILFPFQVDDGRPSYCGHPGYKITCENDSPEIQIGSKTYRVAGRRIDYANQLLTVVDKRFEDNGYCPIPSEDNYLPQPPLFGLPNPSFNVTLCHNCSEPINNPALEEVPCLQKIEAHPAYYTIMTPSALSPDVRKKCNVSVLPILSGAYTQLTGNQMTIVEAAKEGFQVYWLTGEEGCLPCRGAGGLCGSDPHDPAKSACFCTDQSQFPDCLRAPASGTNTRKPVKIVIGLSAGVGGIILSVFLFIIKKKRKARYTHKERLFFFNKAVTISRNVEAFLENYGSFSPKRYKYAEIKKDNQIFQG
ncbi:hypothetical protein H6P81_010454 [Aristolochia fimbriata]|uniref:Uncharacterized protein n=1 Tax=Aristolochia fimbriata TaxID=158543 RepID=A0AAV7EQ06_ARIFI|nr:hypothetical protein H6P81_010454 [Aristolochia fimbriata]